MFVKYLTPAGWIF